MRTLALRAGLILGAFILASCQSPAPQFTSQDEATLRAVFDSVVAEASSARWDAWAGHYAADGSFQPPNGPPVRGHAAILAWGQSFPAIESLAFSDVQVAGEGNLAYGTSAYAIKLKGLPADTGKQLVVFRRAPGAAWEVQAASFNSNLPVPGAPPTPTPKTP
jgi:ketosteroid isomerase-like protein